MNTMGGNQTPAKILIIAPTWVGDMIMAQALLLSLKQRFPDVIIDVLAPEWSYPVLSRMPGINQAICLKLKHGELNLAYRRRLGVQLRANNYSQAIVLPNTWKSALIPWFAKIPVRTGWIGECRFGLLNDIRYLNKNKLPKMVQRYFYLGFTKQDFKNSNYELEAAPITIPNPRLSICDKNTKQVLAKFNLTNISSSKIIALCPGAAFGPAKRWPVKYFVELATAKIAQGYKIWLFGSQQDIVVINEITQALPKDKYVCFTGKINLFDTIDLFALVDCVVSNDSGLMHMAASVNTPVIAIYGSTSPKFTPPLGERAVILKRELSCSPCFKRECPLGHFKCMNDILPSEVLGGIRKLIIDN